MGSFEMRYEAEYKSCCRVLGATGKTGSMDFYLTITKIEGPYCKGTYQYFDSPNVGFFDFYIDQIKEWEVEYIMAYSPLGKALA